MKTITVWAAYTTVDECGRRGELIGVWQNVHDARQSAKGRGWYGGDGLVEPRKAIAECNITGPFTTMIYLLDAKYTQPIEIDVDILTNKEEARRKALAKLSSEEKQLLGIVDED